MDSGSDKTSLGSLKLPTDVVLTRLKIEKKSIEKEGLEQWTSFPYKKRSFNRKKGLLEETLKVSVSFVVIFY